MRWYVDLTTDRNKMASNKLVLQPYPAVDTDGWIDTPLRVLDRVMSDFFLSEYSQTENWPTRVASYVWIFQNNQHDPQTTATETGETLTTLLLKYFPNVTIEAGWGVVDNSSTTSHLTLYIVVTDLQGTEYNVARAILQDGLRVTEIIKIMNGA